MQVQKTDKQSRRNLQKRKRSETYTKRSRINRWKHLRSGKTKPDSGWTNICGSSSRMRRAALSTRCSARKILCWTPRRQPEQSIYPWASKFWCRGKRSTGFAFLEADNSLIEKCSYIGSLWLEQITYFKGDGSDEVIIFSKHDRYISPKANEAFDAFEKIAKNRDENKNFGDF